LQGAIISDGVRTKQRNEIEVIKDVQVINDRQFVFKGVSFRLLVGDYKSHVTTSEEVVILKGLLWFETYYELIKEANVKVLFELGIFEGGSAILFALLFPDLKVIALDIGPTRHVVKDKVRALGLEDRVKLHFGTSQDDAIAINKILSEEAPNGVGMVIDDASHHFELTQRSFELIYPRVKWSGYYIVEDWAWSHQQGIWQTEYWIERPALTNLIFRFSVLIASRPDLVQSMTLTRNYCCLKKSAALSHEPLALEECLALRGKELALI
jgi:hypothetical protein